MNHTVTAIRNMYHFEPLSELALQRYAITPEGIVEFNDGEIGEEDVEFVLELMELYSGLDAFRAERFNVYSIYTILEYLESTHAFYETALLPKLEQSIHGIKKLFPDHPINKVLEGFFNQYKSNLLSHIDAEESRLFPYARRLAHGGMARDYSVEEFESTHTHEEVEDSLDRVINLIETNYSEVSRSFAYRSFKNMLEQFRLDIEIHHLIEEEVFLNMLRLLESENRLPFQ
tara:strand:- start:5 stop:697 length:693 start_codon:yes stop_codon:yes gene_type:complete